MTVVIPTNYGLPAFRQTVELDGTFYDLSFQINRRDARWRMNIGRGGVTYVSAIVLLTDRDLMAPHKSDSRMPQGRLTVIDTLAMGRDPTETGLGTEWLLTYETVS